VEVVKLACERSTVKEIDELEANVRLAERAARDNDFSQRTLINLEFYRMLAHMTRNPLLVALVDAVTSVTHQFVNEVGPTSNRSVMPFRRQLLRHLRAGEADVAAEKMRTHLLRLQKIYLGQLAAAASQESASRTARAR
jgi:DNA-binding FadR family transcriptional regulator